MIDPNQKTTEFTNFDSINEENDDSEELIKFLKPYLILFEIEKFYYTDAYGIFLREKQYPFRIISIYKHYLKNNYEVRSHQVHDDDTHSKIYNFSGGKMSCIKIAKKIILGFDRMYSLNQEIKSLKML